MTKHPFQFSKGKSKLWTGENLKSFKSEIWGPEQSGSFTRRQKSFVLCWVVFKGSHRPGTVTSPPGQWPGLSECRAQEHLSYTLQGMYRAFPVVTHSIQAGLERPLLWQLLWSTWVFIHLFPPPREFHLLKWFIRMAFEIRQIWVSKQ
jgi:hypothetical protein